MAIRAAPSEMDARTVYADWLIQRGDPRGEWIALHREDSDEAELKRRALWQRHGAKWRAEDTGTDDAKARMAYRGGFLEEASLEADRLVALAPVLAHQPIRSLEVYNLADLDVLAKLPVLETVETLELGYGLENATSDALSRLLAAVPRLRALALKPQVDVPMVWQALERFPRIGELAGFRLENIRVTADRARWLGRTLRSVERLQLGCALDESSLLELAEHATFELAYLRLTDQDGHAGRRRLMSDTAIALVLQSPLVRSLDTLSLFGCGVRSETGRALATMPCAATLKRLDLGSQEYSSIVGGLEDCRFPALTWLSVRHDKLEDHDVDSIKHFTKLTTLQIEMNGLGAAGVRKILAHMPELVTLSISDNPLGNRGVLAIARSEHVASLRHLKIGSTKITNAAIEGLVEGGKLNELRTLDLACNELGRPAVIRLADGPFDKLSELSLAYGPQFETAPLFAESWLPADEPGEDKYQRRLDLTGRAVPHASARAGGGPLRTDALTG